MSIRKKSNPIVIYKSNFPAVKPITIRANATNPAYILVIIINREI